MITVDTLDNVEEADRQFFEQTEDGKFKLSRAKIEQAAKAPLDKKNRELLGKLAKSKDLDDADLERIKKLKSKPEKLAALEAWLEDQEEDDDDGEDKDKSKQVVDAKKIAKQIRAELKKEYDPLIKAKDDEIASEREKFNAYRFDQELTGEALEHGAIGARLRKFKAAAISEGQFAYREGKLVALDEDGEIAPESATERMQKLANDPDWKFFFEAKEAGGGSGQQKGKAGGGKPLKRSEMTPKEKAKYIGEFGESKYLQLPA